MNAILGVLKVLLLILLIVTMFSNGKIYSWFPGHTHTNAQTHIEDTSDHAVHIPVKVVLVMGGGLHMGDLLSWGNKHTLRHFLPKTIQSVVYLKMFYLKLSMLLIAVRKLFSPFTHFCTCREHYSWLRVPLQTIATVVVVLNKNSRGRATTDWEWARAPDTVQVGAACEWLQITAS